MTAAYAPAMMSCLLGEPSWELIQPLTDGLPYQAHVRFGPHAATVEDPEYCRAVAKAWLCAANALDAAAYARRRVAAQLAPLDAAGPDAPASTPPEADESAGPAARNGDGWAAPVITLYAENDLEPAPEPEPCGPCQFGNHDACKLARPDGETCPCHTAGHRIDDPFGDDPEPEAEDEPEPEDEP